VRARDLTSPVGRAGDIAPDCEAGAADITIEGLLVLLRAAIEAAGTARAWCRRHGVTESLVSDVLNRHRAPSEIMLRALGYQKRVVYRPRQASASGEHRDV
jgi:hypothetical protein